MNWEQTLLLSRSTSETSVRSRFCASWQQQVALHREYLTGKNQTCSHCCPTSPPHALSWSGIRVGGSARLSPWKLGQVTLAEMGELTIWEIRQYYPWKNKLRLNLENFCHKIVMSGLYLLFTQTWRSCKNVQRTWRPAHRQQCVRGAVVQMYAPRATGSKI